MSKKAEPKAEKQEVAKVSVEDRAITFVPMGEKDPIELTIKMIRNLIAKPTKNGVHATDGDIMGFMMLCKAQELNPWTNDCYLIGFDGTDGAEFALIPAKQALDKRAEAHPEYLGIKAGVVIKTDDAIIKRKGCLYFEKDGEKLVGGWAKVYRKDKKPFYVDRPIEAYRKQNKFWKDDPGGMITKVAKAGALREAFPTQTAGLYLREEHEAGMRNITPAIKTAGAELLENTSSEPTPKPKTKPKTEGKTVEAEVVNEPKKETPEPKPEAAEPKPDPARFKGEVIENIKENLMPPNEVTDKELTDYVTNEGFELGKDNGWDSLPKETLEKIESGWEAIDNSIQEGRSKS